MSWRKRMVLGVLAFLVLGIVGALLIRAREPHYQGEPVSYWLRQSFKSVSGRGMPPSGAYIWSPKQGSTEAIKALGTNAIPCILPLLHARDSNVKLKVNEWLNKQSLVKFRFETAGEKQGEAFWALNVLGPETTGQLPGLVISALIRCAHDTNGSRLSALVELENLKIIRPAEALPLVLSGAEDADGEVIHACVRTLLKFGQSAKTNDPEGFALLHKNLPRLQAAVTNWSFYVSGDLIALISRFPDVDFSVSTLLGLASSHMGLTRAAAINALGGIHQKLDEVVPALIQHLSYGDPGSRRAAALVLGQFGKDAQAAVPVLVDFIKSANTPDSRERLDLGSADDPFSVLRSFEQGLKEIDPEAAKEAGVK